MTELHPSISAVGSHLDELAAPTEGRSAQEDRPASRTIEHLTLAVRELGRHVIAPEKVASEADLKTDEAMHLDQ